MPFEPTTPPPAMTPERCREVLTQMRGLYEEVTSPAGYDDQWHPVCAAALRMALARLAALDAVASAARDFLAASDAGDVSFEAETLRLCLAQLGGPTDA